MTADRWLRRAVLSGAADGVATALGRGADPDQPIATPGDDPLRLPLPHANGTTGTEGWTGLHLAAARDDDGVAAALLAGGARIDAATRFGDRPLEIAARWGSTRVALQLIAAGGPPGTRALPRAAAGGHADIVAALLAAGLQSNLDGALVCAGMWHGNRETAAALLKAGADPAAPATRPRRLEVIADDRGRDSTSPRGDSGDGHPWTVRTWAMYCGHASTLELLRGTPQRDLADAAIDDDEAGIRRFADAGQSPDLPLAYRHSPLVCACHLGNHRAVAALLEVGADPDTRSPWRRAVERGHLACVELLEAAGATVDDVLRVVEGTPRAPITSYRWALDRDAPAELSPLLLKTSNPERLELLLKRGADPGYATERGYTPLMHCAFERRADAIDVLLAAGADPQATDCDGHTAMHYALYDPEFPDEPPTRESTDPEDPTIRRLMAAGLPLPEP